MANTYARNHAPVPAHTYAISAEHNVSGGLYEMFMTPQEAASYDQAAFLIFAAEVQRVARTIIQNAKQPKQLALIKVKDEAQAES